MSCGRGASLGEKTFEKLAPARHGRLSVPRSGWIASGAVIASFAVVAADRRLLAVVVAGVGVALLIGALVSRRQTPLAGLALGAALIALAVRDATRHAGADRRHRRRRARGR